MNFVGKAERRTQAGLNAAAAIVGCDPAALHADIQVEAGTSGYDKHSRPKMLFEPHLFYRALSPAARSVAVSQGLAYQKWGTRPYPLDSYPRLAAAMRINPEAALKSASWGLPQVLGSNYAACGYVTVEEMVEAFVTQGEDEHLRAMASFIKHNPAMRRALVAHDWTAFARLYNGPSSRGYSDRLALAYKNVIAISPEEANRQVVVSHAESKGVVKVTQSATTAAVAVAVPAVAVMANTHAAHHAWPWVVGGVLAFFAAVDGVAASVWFNKKKQAQAEPHPASTPPVTPPAATAPEVKVAPVEPAPAPMVQLPPPTPAAAEPQPSPAAPAADEPKP